MLITAHADDNFENMREHKGIFWFQAFPPFKECFDKPSYPGSLKCRNMCQRVDLVDSLHSKVFLHHLKTTYNEFGTFSFERAISPLPTVFSIILETFRRFHQIQNCRLQTLSFWKSRKFAI